jgi:lipopolysaccharide transport system ATP-binding protein
VGDLLFQQKCGRRLRELVARGVTLLVVTHDTAFVLNICQRALWLHQGRMAYLGEAADCVREYLAAMGAEAGNEAALASLPPLTSAAMPAAAPLDIQACRRLGDGGVAVKRVWLLTAAGQSSAVFRLGDWCRVVLQIRAEKAVRLVSGGCELRDRHGQVMFATGLRVVRRLIESIPAGESRLVVMRFRLDLAPGQYSLDVGCGAGESEDNSWQKALAVAVIDLSATPGDEVVHGLVRLPYEVSAHLGDGTALA